MRKQLGTHSSLLHQYTAWQFVTVTHHTSHITRHTSHVTHHTSHFTRHTSHVLMRAAGLPAQPPPLSLSVTVAASIAMMQVDACVV